MSVDIVSRALGLGLFGLMSLTTWAIEPPMKKAAAVQVPNGSIVVDGKLDDEGWQKAPVHTGFEMPTSMSDRSTFPSNAQTSFQVAWDNTTLYFGVRCNEPNVAGMRPYPAPEVWDAAMWANDCIELFFDPTGTRDCYYHFAAGPNGAQYDAFWVKGQNHYFSSAWQTKTIVGKDSWTIEFGIPLADLNMVPAANWVDTWILTACRTASACGGSMMYSPTESFHSIKQSGTLSGMPAALKRFNLTCDDVLFKLQPDAQGTLALLPTFTFSNHGNTPFAGTVEVDAKGEKTDLAITVPPGTNTVVNMPALAGIGEGGVTVNLRIIRADRTTELIRRFDDTLTYVPIAIRLTEPCYRGTIYPSQRNGFNKIRGVVTLGMPVEQVTNCMLHVVFRSADTNTPKSETNIAVTASELSFKLPAEYIKVKDYAVDAELRKPGLTGEALVVARTSVIVPSLPPAPGIEVRIDSEGNVLVDGNSTIVRGFYGGMSRFSPDFFRLPRSVNYMNTDAPEMWTLVDVKQLVDEPSVKTDPPIPEALTNAIKAIVASVRDRRNVLGYYLEEDCGGRGVPASYLKKFYDILRAEDPYRIVVLTESPYPGTLAACDVLCTRQWRKIAVDEVGTRRFVEDVTRVGEAVTTTLQTPGKASWCGPQAFAYAEEMGDARLRHLTPMEQRFIMLDCLARGTRGFTCHTLWNYQANMAARRAIDSTFDEMAWLDTFWRVPGAGRKATSDNPAIRLGARSRYVGEGAPQLFTVIAVNESEQTNTATITGLSPFFEGGLV